MKLSDLGEDVRYIFFDARQQECLSCDLLAMHGLQFTPTRTVQQVQEILDSGRELTAEEVLEFQKIVLEVKDNWRKAIECDRRYQEEAERLERDFPTQYDENGRAYRNFRDYETGRVYRNYIEMGN